MFLLEKSSKIVCSIIALAVLFLLISFLSIDEVMLICASLLPVIWILWKVNSNKEESKK